MMGTLVENMLKYLLHDYRFIGPLCFWSHYKQFLRPKIFQNSSLMRSFLEAWWSDLKTFWTHVLFYTQQIFTCSKLITNTSEKGVKDFRSKEWSYQNDVIDFVMVLLLLHFNIFHTFYSCFLLLILIMYFFTGLELLINTLEWMIQIRLALEYRCCMFFCKFRFKNVWGMLNLTW